jgi:lipooligosaccharide transport system permease protein
MSETSLFRIPNVGRRVWHVWKRDLDVFMKTYKVNFIPPILEPILYLVAIGFGLGIFVEAIGDKTFAEFLAPALLAISMMMAAFFECTYASFVRMYYQKTFDAIVATPVNMDEVVAGEILWGATRSTIYTSIMLVVVSMFGLVQYPTALLVIPLAFLAGLMFASFGMIFTAITPSIESLNYPTSLVITPMFLISGTFFPITILPEPAQYFAYAIVPLVHVVDISRACAYGTLELDLVWNLLWILAATALFFIVSLNLMRRRLVI